MDNDTCRRCFYVFYLCRLPARPNNIVQVMDANEFSSSKWNSIGIFQSFENVKRAALLAINRPYVSSNNYCCKSSIPRIFLGRGRRFVTGRRQINSEDRRRGTMDLSSTADFRKIHDHCALFVGIALLSHNVRQLKILRPSVLKGNTVDEISGYRNLIDRIKVCV